MSAEAEKLCPFCAETIKAAAVVCKHCGRDLPAPKTAEQLTMERLGITYADSRYQWRGNYFRDLASAVDYAERNQATLPPMPPLSDGDRASGASKPFKWWLWLPLGAVALFLAYGLTIPKHEAEARELRNACEKLGGSAYECNRVHDERIRRGESKDKCPPEAPGCSWDRK